MTDATVEWATIISLVAIICALVAADIVREKRDAKRYRSIRAELDDITWRMSRYEAADLESETATLKRLGRAFKRTPKLP